MGKKIYVSKRIFFSTKSDKNLLLSDAQIEILERPGRRYIEIKFWNWVIDEWVLASFNSCGEGKHLKVGAKKMLH